MGLDSAPLLSISNLRTSFFTDKGEVRAVDDVSFDIHRGQTLALVGESGCGKSVAALSIMRLISDPGRVVGGSILFKGQELLKLSEKEMRRIRGKSIGMVFQEPMTSLNPVMSVGDQIGEVFKIHTSLSDREIRKHVIGLLEKVHIADPERRIDQYPHEMSGGMKQRVMIAMALACSPDLLIADEPTTALDVTIQAQILDLLAALQKDLGMAILLITHNLGVVAQFSKDIIVMYASKIAERAPVGELFKNATHPYTKALLKSLPRPGERQERLEAIPGTVPSPLVYPPGCHFSSRCSEVMEHCPTKPPPTIRVGESHETVCWLYD
jgi:oligopeptide/dipeptide ABC transporter ATP-binding protein